MTLNDFLTTYEEAATQGGSGSVFLAQAYLSWYRPSDDFKVNLYDATRLDSKNRKLFFTLLYLREAGDFEDEVLFQFERRLANHLRIKNERSQQK